MLYSKLCFTISMLVSMMHSVCVLRSTSLFSLRVRSSPLSCVEQTLRIHY
jgi:hypothetical protein